MRRRIVAALAGLALSAPVFANEPHRAANDPLFGGLVQERDVGLVFDYLREVFGAAVEGREPPSADELRRRAEGIGDEMKRRGAAAAQAVLETIERSIREGMREPPRPPPANSRQRI